jgi:hypothetical protein
MSGGRFKIIESIKSAYVFAWRNTTYLLMAAVVPLVTQIVSDGFLQYIGKGDPLKLGFIEYGLWTLPAQAVLAWFLFIEARLIFLGESIYNLPKEPQAIAARNRAMQASILMALVFHMILIVFQAVTQWSASVAQSSMDATAKPNSMAMTAGMLSIGAMFWALRFMAAPVVMSIGLSLRQFIFRVNGVEFSLRLLGLWILAWLPVFFIYGLFATLLFGDKPEMSSGDIYVSNLLDAPFGIIGSAVATAAMAFAIKEIMAGASKKS